MDPETQGQHEAALLALGGVGPCLATLDRQTKVVAVGAHGVDAPAQVVGPAGGERIEQLAVQLRSYPCSTTSGPPSPARRL